MSEITKLNLFDLVNNIKNKKISSEEVTKAFIERSEKSKKLNAYITEDFSSALEKAKKFDKKPNFELKLPGVPIAVKDLFCTKNLRTTAGSKILNNFIPSYESTVTNNIWNEGAILLGKLNCDEFAMGSSNETSFFGNVQNPIDKNLVPGGSSGGSAAALAGQLTPVTIGSIVTKGVAIDLFSSHIETPILLDPISKPINLAFRDDFFLKFSIVIILYIYYLSVSLQSI